MGGCGYRSIQRSPQCPWRLNQSSAVAKRSDHGPYSNKINYHGHGVRPLESSGKLEARFIDALIERISEGNLLAVVPWQ